MLFVQSETQTQQGQRQTPVFVGLGSHTANCHRKTQFTEPTLDIWMRLGHFEGILLKHTVHIDIVLILPTINLLTAMF